MHRFPLVVGYLAVAAVLTACGSSTSPGNPTTPTPPIATATPADQPSADHSEESPEPSPDAGDELTGATIQAQGLGPIRLGMSLPEAQAHGWVAESRVCANAWGASAALLGEGASLKFSDGRLQEIWITKPTWATEAGVRVGDSAESLAEAYGPDLKTETRPAGGHTYEARFVTDQDEELLFLGRSPQDRAVGTIVARHGNTPLLEGC